MLRGAGSGGAGVNRLSAARQKGVKTLYGSPDLVSMSPGSNSSAALKSCVSMPRAASAALICRSRSRIAGS